MRKAFSLLEICIVLSVVFIILAVGIPTVSRSRIIAEKAIREQQRTHPELSQEAKDALQKQGEQTARERAESNSRENQQTLLNRIQQEEQAEYQIQQEYISQLQPFSFVVSPWQLNRKENLKVFVLYDVQNKQEYIIVQNVYHPEFMTITPRIKNENPSKD